MILNCKHSFEITRLDVKLRICTDKPTANFLIETLT